MILTTLLMPTLSYLKGYLSIEKRGMDLSAPTRSVQENKETSEFFSCFFFTINMRFILMFFKNDFYLKKY
jgi:hypothetical protein